MRAFRLDGGADVGVMVTEGVIVRFGRFVRGGNTLDRCELFVAGVMVVPAARVAPAAAASEDLGGGSIEWLLPLPSRLLLLPRCEPDDSAAAAAATAAAVAAEELMLRLLLALREWQVERKMF